MLERGQVGTNHTRSKMATGTCNPQGVESSSQRLGFQPTDFDGRAAMRLAFHAAA